MRFQGQRSSVRSFLLLVLLLGIEVLLADGSRPPASRMIASIPGLGKERQREEPPMLSGASASLSHATRGLRGGSSLRCSPGWDPVSVEQSDTFCAPLPVCSGSNTNGSCPGPQEGLPYGAHCKVVKTGVAGCVVNTKAPITATPPSPSLPPPSPPTADPTAAEPSSPTSATKVTIGADLSSSSQPVTEKVAPAPSHGDEERDPSAPSEAPTAVSEEEDGSTAPTSSEASSESSRSPSTDVSPILMLPPSRSSPHAPVNSGNSSETGSTDGGSEFSAGELGNPPSGAEGEQGEWGSSSNTTEVLPLTPSPTSSAGPGGGAAFSAESIEKSGPGAAHLDALAVSGVAVAGALAVLTIGFFAFTLLRKKKGQGDKQGTVDDGEGEGEVHI